MRKRIILLILKVYVYVYYLLKENRYVRYVCLILVLLFEIYCKFIEGFLIVNVFVYRL